MANFISIFRIFLVFISAGLLYINSSVAYIWAFCLTVVAFCLDGLDGYVARKFNETSKLGAILDIMGDRIAEYVYWIVFACLGWLPACFPIIVVARGVITDSLRSVGMEHGLIPFGMGSMLDDPVSQWICGARPIKIGYAAAKAVAFCLLIFAYIPNLRCDIAYSIEIVAMYFAVVSIFLCVIRGIPVVFESKKFFKKNND